MKKATLNRLLLSVAGALLFLMGGCSKENTSRASLEAVGDFERALGSAAQDDDGDDAMDLDLARQVVQWESYLKSGFGTNGPASDGPDADPFPDVAQAQPIKELLEAARSKLVKARVDAAALISELPARTAHDHAVLAREAAQALRSVAAELVRASVDQDIVRMIQAEAQLRARHQTLVKAGTRQGVKIDSEPFSLLAGEQIGKMRTHIAPLRRRMEQVFAMTQAPEDANRLNVYKSFETRCSEEEKKTSREERWKQEQKNIGGIKDKHFADAVLDESARIDMYRRQGVAEFAAATKQPEALLEAAPTRGPPGSWAVGLGRNYELSPVEWTRDRARIEALGDALMAHGRLEPEFSEASSVRRGMAAIGDRDLARIVREVQISSVLDGTPGRALLPQRSAFQNALKEAAEAEISRRVAGGKQVEVPASLLDFTRPPMSHRYEARLVDLITDRWPVAEQRPLVLQHDYHRILKGRAAEYAAQFASNLRKLAEANRRLVLSTDVSPGNPPLDLLRDIEKAKSLSFLAAGEAEYFFGRIEKQGISLPAERNAVWAAQALFPRGPPPDGSFLPAGPAGPDPHLPPTGGQSWALDEDVARAVANEKISPSNYRLESSLIKLERLTFQISDSLNKLPPLLARLPSTSPELIGSLPGRLTVSEAELKTADFVPSAKKVEAAKARLPEREAKYAGRMNKETGKPYDFEAVKKPKTFRALGGGIHFGSTAQPDNGVDLKTAVLTWDLTNGLSFRDGRTGKEWVIEKDVDPTALRALYRFVAHGRNAAVSIGWGENRQSFLEVAANLNETNTTVLLDPYLVDTSIGQVLIAADTIPWDLDELPSETGGPLSFAKEFFEAKSRYRQHIAQRIEAWLKTVSPRKTLNGAAAVELAEKRKMSAKALLLLKFDAPTEEALAWYRDQEFDRVLEELSTDLGPAAKREVLSAYTRGKVLEILTKRYSAQLRELVRKQDPDAQIDSAKLTALAREQAEKAMSDLADEMNKEAFNAFATPDTRDRLITGLMIESLIDAKSKNRALVEAWAAYQLGSGKSVQQVSERLQVMMNATTLAVLYDDSSLFKLPREGPVGLAVSMKYRYATTRVEISDSRIGLGFDGQGSEVETIEDLTILVNTRYDEIERAFAPVRRVGRHAAIAALLRWADQAVDKGELAMVDLAALAKYPTNNRTEYPTPDAITRK